MVLTRITPDAADFLAIVDLHKHWGEPLDFNERKVWRNRTINVHAAQACALAFCCFRINRSDFAVESLAPGATGLFEYYELSRTSVRERRKNNYSDNTRADRKTFPYR